MTSNLADVAWAHHSSALSGLSFHFTVRSEDPELGRYVEALLASLHSNELPSHCYSLMAGDPHGYDLYLDERRIAQVATPSDAIDWLLWDINRATADASHEHLLFHAGGVQHGQAGVLFPAPSGSGKSTLVAALVRGGLRYLSDELVALTGTGTQLLPFPKPLSLKAGSFELLGDVRPPTDDASARFRGDEWYLPLGGIGPDVIGSPCEPRFVVVPRFTADAVTELSPLSRTEAFLALAINSVNLDQHGAAGAHTLGDVIEACECYQLVMSDLQQACHLVQALVTDNGADHVE